MGYDSGFTSHTLSRAIYEVSMKFNSNYHQIGGGEKDDINNGRGWLLAVSFAAVYSDQERPIPISTTMPIELPTKRASVRSDRKRIKAWGLQI